MMLQGSSDARFFFFFYRARAGTYPRPHSDGLRALPIRSER